MLLAAGTPSSRRTPISPTPHRAMTRFATRSKARPAQIIHSPQRWISVGKLLRSTLTNCDPDHRRNLFGSLSRHQLRHPQHVSDEGRFIRHPRAQLDRQEKPGALDSPGGCATRTRPGTSKNTPPFKLNLHSPNSARNALLFNREVIKAFQMELAAICFRHYILACKAPASTRVLPQRFQCTKKSLTRLSLPSA